MTFFEQNLLNANLDELSRFDFIDRLSSCEQDPVFHPEGNVFIHTQMVLDELALLNEYQTLSARDKLLVRSAAILHDIAKPQTTVLTEEGRISAPGHAAKGSRMVREIALREEALDFDQRETIVSLVRWHMLPLTVSFKKDPERMIIMASQTVDLKLLYCLAKADIRGRGGQNEDRDYAVDYFKALAEELNCFGQPFAFKSNYDRLVYFSDKSKHHSMVLYDHREFDFYLMSGLIASGKSSWLKQKKNDWPIISLDELRTEMKIDASENQGRVIQKAKAMAKTYLAAKQSFYWDATNLTRQTRSQLIDLALKYNARINIIYLEAPLKTILRRNKSRLKPVPLKIIDQMIQKLEVPDITEADTMTVVINDDE